MRIILLILNLFTLSIFAQEVEIGKDSIYVEKIKPLISFRPFVTQNWDLLFLSEKGNSETAMLYRPATGMNIGGEFGFSFMRFSYQRNMPFLQPDLPANFEPFQQRIGVDFGGRIFGLSVNFQKTNGFYLLNPTSYNQPVEEIPENVIYRDDINSYTFGVDFRFTFSKELSANALFNQTERQLKSKGSFTLIFGDHYHNFTADTSLLPILARPNYEESATTERIWVNTFHVMPGYGYIAVAGKWNFGLFLYYGSGLQFRKYYNDTEEKLALRFPIVAKGKAGITYNGHNFYSRLTTSADFTSLGMKDANFRWMQSLWELSIGIRFFEN